MDSLTRQGPGFTHIHSESYTGKQRYGATGTATIITISSQRGIVPGNSKISSAVGRTVGGRVFRLLKGVAIYEQELLITALFHDMRILIYIWSGLDHWSLAIIPVVEMACNMNPVRRNSKMLYIDAEGDQNISRACGAHRKADGGEEWCQPLG